MLGAFSRQGERPLVPLNLVGDYGGGAMMLAFGVLAAIISARETGEGQVVDAAMAEGSSLLATLIHSMRDLGMWTDEPGTNLLDSGAHFYEVYECADGGHFAVGALEPQFYAELLRLLELDPEEFPQMERDRWGEMKVAFAELFRTRTRDEWAAVFEGTEACATPVLGLGEAPRAPPQRGARELRRGRRRAAAGPGAQVRRHPGRDPVPRTRARRRHRLGALGVGALGRRDRGPA